MEDRMLTNTHQLFKTTYYISYSPVSPNQIIQKTVSYIEQESDFFF